MKQFFGLLFVAAAVFFATLPTDKQHIATAANTCVVTFDGNGGTPSQSTKTVTVGGTYGTLPTASRSGHTFLGWYTSPGSAGTPVVSTTKVESPYSHKIYAHWKANTVTVSFSNNGGYGNVPSQTYTIGSTYGSLPSGSTPPAGYYFVGWFTSPSGGSQIYGSTTVSASYTTLYAHYERNTYTIYFDADGGSASFSSKNVTYGDTYGSLPSASKQYHTFLGWYKDGSQVTSSTPMNTSASHTLYAHWRRDTVTVAFDSNGGYGNVPSQTYNVGATYGSHADQRHFPRLVHRKIRRLPDSDFNDRQCLLHHTVRALFARHLYDHVQCQRRHLLHGVQKRHLRKLLRYSADTVAGLPHLPRLVHRQDRRNSDFRRHNDVDKCKPYLVCALEAKLRDRCL